MPPLPQPTRWPLGLGLILALALALAATLALFPTAPAPPTTETTLTPAPGVNASPTLITKVRGTPPCCPTVVVETDLDPFVATSEAEKAAQIQAQLDMTHLTYNSGFSQAIPAALDAQWLAAVAVSSATDPVYGVVQFRYTDTIVGRYALEAAGAVFYDGANESGLLGRIPPEAVPVLHDLHASGLVRYAGFIPPQARLPVYLWEMAQLTPTHVLSVAVTTFDAPTPAQEAEIGQWLKIREKFFYQNNYKLVGDLRIENAPKLAELPYIWFIAERRRIKLTNLESTMALGSDVAQWNLATTGAGVQIAVMDTGIGVHGDFASRIVDQSEYYPSNDPFAEDEDGHGTHVAGTAAGSGQGDPGGGPWSWRGHAPGADLLIYKLCCDQYGEGFETEKVEQALRRSAANGGDVINNSYGSGYITYTSDIAMVADKAVRGDYGQYPQMVVSAGNDNDAITTPGVAKNVITVGAVKDGNAPNILLDFGVCLDTNWPPGERVCFSNYGPVNLDGDGSTRVKPDLVAPGVNIVSTWRDGGYQPLDGTSMAAPAVSGAAALLVERYGLAEWPELTKAILLATAVDIGGVPNYYGRGLPDVYHALQAQPGVAGPVSFWAGQVLTTGQLVTHTFTVPNPYAYIRAALTWADPPFQGDAVNDLDLALYTNATCTGSPIAQSTSVDDTIEYIHKTVGPAGGTWCVRVRAYRLIQSQYFGLAVYPVMREPSLSLSAPTCPVAAQQGLTFALETQLTNSGNTAGGTFVSLIPPPGFTLLYAKLYSAGVPLATYAPGDLHSANGQWDVATGEVVKDIPRKIVWYFVPDPTLALGTYTFALSASHRKAGSTLLASNAPCAVGVAAAHHTYLPATFHWPATTLGH